MASVPLTLTSDSVLYNRQNVMITGTGDAVSTGYNLERSFLSLGRYVRQLRVFGFAHLYAHLLVIGPAVTFNEIGGQHYF